MGHDAVLVPKSVGCLQLSSRIFARPTTHRSTCILMCYIVYPFGLAMVGENDWSAKKDDIAKMRMMGAKVIKVTSRQNNLKEAADKYVLARRTAAREVDI